MRSKKIKVCSLVLATAVCSALFGVPHKAESATIKNGIVYITESDVKNGKVTIKDTNAKSIIVKKSVKKATIQLNNVKLSGGLSFEKGNFVLKTKKTSVNSLKISGKNTKIKLDKASDLNNKNITLTVAKNTTGNIDLTSFGKNVNVNLGENTDFKLAIGKKDSAKVTIKKAHESSVFEVAGKGEGSKVSKITVESPVVLVVNVDTAVLETKKAAAKASITVLRSADQIKNEGKAEIKEAFNETENSKADTVKDNNIKEENSKESTPGANTGGGLGGGGGSLGGGGNLGGGGGGLGGGGNLGGGGGSLGGGSSVPQKPATGIEFVTNNFNISKDGGELEVKVKYIGGNSGKIEWKVEGKDETNANKPNVVEIVTKSETNTIKIKARNNGNYKIIAKLEGGNGTDGYKSVEGKVEGQVLELDAEQEATYKAENGKITKKNGQSFAPKKYILEVVGSDRYWRVSEDGSAKGTFSKDEAVSHPLSQRLNNSVKSITGLDNAYKYKVHEVSEQEELEAKDKILISAYVDFMKKKVDDIKFSNAQRIKDEAEKMITDLTQRRNAGGKAPVFENNIEANIKDSTWDGILVKATEQKSQLSSKASRNLELLNNVKQDVKVEIAKLKLSESNEKVDGLAAVGYVEKIESELDKIRNVEQNYPIYPDIIDNALYMGYVEAKKEVDTYKRMEEQKLEYHCSKDGNYVLTVKKRVIKNGSQEYVDAVFEEGLKYEIEKLGAGNNYTSTGIQGNINIGESFSLKAAFDKKNNNDYILKNGEYVIKVVKEFTFLTTFQVRSNDVQTITDRP